MQRNAKRRLAPMWMALFMCLLAPFLWWLPVLPLFGGLITALLCYVGLSLGYVYFGVAALAFVGMSGAGAYFLYEMPFYFGVAFASLCAICALVAVLLLLHRQPFFFSVRMVCLSALFIVVAAYSLITAIHMDPVTAYVEYGRRIFEEAPSDLMDPILIVFSELQQIPALEISEGGGLTQAMRAQGIDSLFSALEIGVRMDLPALLVSWILMAGVLGCYLPLRFLPRYGNPEKATPCIDITAIRIPRRVNSALLLGTIALLLLGLFGGAVMGILFMAIWPAVVIVYAVQGAGVSEWYLKKKGMKKGIRGALIFVCFAIELFRPILFFIGLVEQVAMFRGLGLEEKSDEEPKG